MKPCAAALVVLSLAPVAATARQPVLVELFTAQGCATCNKANASAAHWIERPGVVVLTWSVDYWDYLGWQDTFAQPGFADRQRAYDTRMGVHDVSTPQIVVGGVVQGAGDKADAIETLVKLAKRQVVAAPQIYRRNEGPRRGRLRPAAEGRGRRLAGALQPVRTGDRGKGRRQSRRLGHRAQRGAAAHPPRLLGRARSKTYPVPPTPEAGLASVVIVQQAAGGPVIAYPPARPEPLNI